MPRVKGGTVTRARRKKTIKLAKVTLVQNAHYIKLQNNKL